MIGSKYDLIYIPATTPFCINSLCINFDMIKPLVDFLIEKQKAEAIIALGTTGESSSLSHDEKSSAIDAFVAAVSGRVPLFVGTGTPSTSETVEMTRLAERKGADGVLVVSPYYIRPTQSGIEAHFKEVAKSTNLPIIIYNIPYRTGRLVETETILKLAEVDNIVGVKDTSCNLSHTMSLISSISKKALDFSVLCGEDNLVFPSMCVGASGAVIASGNILSLAFIRMRDLIKEGNISSAREIHYNIIDLVNAMFIEPNPAGIKYILDHVCPGLGGPLRLPLQDISNPCKDVINRCLETCNQIKYLINK